MVDPGALYHLVSAAAVKGLHSNDNVLAGLTCAEVNNRTGYTLELVPMLISSKLNSPDRIVGMLYRHLMAAAGTR